MTCRGKAIRPGWPATHLSTVGCCSMAERSKHYVACTRLPCLMILRSPVSAGAILHCRRG